MKTCISIFLMWFVVYTSVTGSLLMFQYFELGLAMPVQTLIITVILVPMIYLFIAPAARRIASALVKER